jgi:hypothetical protein
MKSDSSPRVSPARKEKKDLWVVQIEPEHVRYFKSEQTAIEFTNTIDVWKKMERLFTRKIAFLKNDLEFDQSNPGQDAQSIRYSVRYCLD